MAKKGTTFKGEKKPYGKSGHFNEPKRHEMQAKGYKTGHLADQVHPLDYVGTPLPKAQIEPELTDEEQLKQEIAKGIGIEDDFRGIEVEDEDDHYIVKAGNQEWLVFNSEDDAEAFAVDRVRQDLEDQPELFEKSWLEGHIDMENLKSMLEDDVTESNQSYFDDIEGESDKNWQNRLVSELIDLAKLDEDDFRAEDGELKEITPELQQKIDDAKDEAVEERTDVDLDDPMEYLEGIYGKGDALKEAIRIGRIDYDEASQDAVDTDGVAHFLASYDGEEVELPNGKVAYRTN